MVYKLKRVYTAHYRYGGPDRVDITVKGQDIDWKPFAPSWDMVMGVKNKTLTEQRYVEMYLRILNNVPVATLDRLLQMEEATFVCFCAQNAFCHRNILVRHLQHVFGDRITYGGWKS